MTFKENLNRICREKGKTLTQVLKELGYSTSKVTAINNGSIPKEETMLELANHLQVSVMDFFADENDIPRDKPMDEDEQDVLRIFRSMTREDKHKTLARLYAYYEKIQEMANK
jgi:transcriptional regulator with XRE-family HTH domain